MRKAEFEERYGRLELEGVYDPKPLTLDERFDLADQLADRADDAWRDLDLLVSYLADLALANQPIPDTLIEDVEAAENDYLSCQADAKAAATNFTARELFG